MRRVMAIVGFLAMAAPAWAADKPKGFKAGVATRVITPKGSVWMAGYASRNKPCSEKLQDLYAKALAFEDGDGNRFVLLTTDLIGLSREVSAAVAAEVQKQTGVPRERLMLTASHTHSGPVVRDNLAVMYDLSADDHKALAAYNEKLRAWLVEAMVEAVKNLAPAKLSVGQGMATFAVNRRQPTPSGIINGNNPDGPVDHDVPVLKVETPEGKLKAVVFGYACHNTTLSGYQWTGDYAGFAQQYVEEAHPGAVALYWAGCGGDANPLPRGKVELCESYGKHLARSVGEVLKGKMTPVEGTCTAKYAEIELPLDTLPGKERWAADLLSKGFAQRKRAERMLATLEKGGKIDDHYRHYPVQAWRLGGQVLWLSLGGEVVVDYSHKLKKTLGGKEAVWVTAYSNDVMAYIPSARVLKEGGYEADSSMIYYGLPTR